MSETPKGDLFVSGSRSRPPVQSNGAPGPHATATIVSPGDVETDSFSVTRIILAFRRNRLLVLGIVIACLAAAALYTQFATPVYKSWATVRINDKDAGNSLLSGLPLQGLGASGKLPTEIEVMRSRRVAEIVAQKLHLNVGVLKPSGRSQLLNVVNAPTDLPPGKLVLTRQATGNYSVRIDGKTQLSQVPKEVQPQIPFLVNGAQFVLDARPGSAPSEIVIGIASFRRVVENLRRTLLVTRPNREAEIATVAYSSSDSVLSAAVPNLVLDEFMKYEAQANKGEASSTVEFLRQQVASYEGQLRGAEAALGAYRETEQVVNVAEESAAQVKRMADLQAERGQLLAERQSLASIIAKAPASGGSAARDIAAFPSFITNRGMQDVLQSLLTLENQRSQLLLRRNPENADVVAVQNRIDDLNGQLISMAKAYLAGIDSKSAASDAALKSFGKQVETIPAKEIAFARLSRQQKLLQDISTLLQTRLKEAEIKEAVQPGDVRILDRALVPDRRSSPKLSINLLIGLLAGLFLGYFAAVLREILDHKVRTHDDVELITSLPVLGTVPSIAPGGTVRNLVRRGARTGDHAVVAVGASSNGTSSKLLNAANSRSGSAEAYRAIRTNITFASFENQRNQVLVFTSALPGDGKSTTAANLALTLVQQGVRTLLIDADMRKGTLHSLFNIRREPGLAQVLVRQAKIEDAIRVLPHGEDVGPLSVLTAGMFPPNPSELLGSDRMKDLIDELREKYEMIIIDSPPLALVTDAAVLGTMADSTILVARAGETDKRALAHAVAQLHYLRVHVSGTIINDFSSKESGYQYGYKYEAYGVPD